MPIRRMVYHAKGESSEHIDPKVPVEEAFRDNEIICMICGQGGMKTLARHLNFIHNLKPGQYRKMFGLNSRKKLTSKAYSESRKQFAMENGAEESLTKAREVRLSGLSGQVQHIQTEESQNENAKRKYRRLHVFSD